MDSSRGSMAKKQKEGMTFKLLVVGDPQSGKTKFVSYYREMLPTGG